MKRIILAALLFLIFTSFVSLSAQWARTYGGSENDEAYSIQQTSDGGYIVSGSTDSFGTELFDAWILKLSSTGAIEWQRTYGGSSYEGRFYVQQTSDGGYIVAGFTHSFGSGGYDYDMWVYLYDIWVLKLDSTGDIEWQRTYGGSGSERDSSIQQTSDGGYIVSGSTNSFSAGDYDVWIIKIDSIGDIEWQRTYSGGGEDYAYSIQQTNYGGYIFAGTTTSFGAVVTTAWIVKLSSVGDVEWQRAYGGSDWSNVHFIQQTSDGGYIVAGFFQSFSDGLWDAWISILKLTSDGNIEWQKTYDGSKEDFVWGSIQQTSDGGYIVAGTTDSYGAGLWDVWILKLNSVGDISPACSFIGSSYASMIDTSVFPEDTSVTPSDTSVTSMDTNIFPQDTDATVALLCGAEEEESDEDGEGIKLPCFIATAAYGSPLHPHIDILRDFRDKYLMPSSSGRKFVSLYYKYSPFAANLIAKHKVLKIVVRIYLVPLVAFSFSMLHFGPIIIGIMLAFIFMLSIVLISLFYRKLRRFQKKLPVPYFS